MPSKNVSYKGKICKILEEREASRSNDPLVKKAFRTEEFGWVIDQDCDSVKDGVVSGQADSQNS